MDNALYLKNVLKTLSTTDARKGLRYVSVNQRRTHIFHSLLALATESGEILDVCRPFLLGGQLSTLDTAKLASEMGDYAYYLRVAARFLKVRLPNAKKKARMPKGLTMQAALLDLNYRSARLANIAKKYLHGVPMKAKEDSDKLVLDKEGAAAIDAERIETARTILEAVIALYWPLCYALLGVPPAVVFAANIEKLATRHPEGTFTMAGQNDKDAEAEDKTVAQTFAKTS